MIYYDLLYDIKNNPEKFNKEFAAEIMDEFEQKVKNAFNDRDQNKDLTFDEDYANLVLSKIYKPYLT